MQPDGSRTVYNFDNAQHTAVATTADADGKLRETIRYQLDNAGRFSSGEILGPDGRIRLKSRYKYDDTGRILEETQSAADGTFQHKIAYSYDPSGKQTGYSVFDASGKLVEPEVQQKAMKAMLAYLNWWATVLRDARKTAPYGEMAAWSR